ELERLSTQRHRESAHQLKPSVPILRQCLWRGSNLASDGITVAEPNTDIALERTPSHARTILQILLNLWSAKQSQRPVLPKMRRAIYRRATATHRAGATETEISARTADRVHGRGYRRRRSDDAHTRQPHQ